MFGALAVYQAILPFLRESSNARIVNVSSGLGSMATNSDPASPHRRFFSPIYAASKTALYATTLAMMVELESIGIKVNLVSPAFTKTNLNGYEGTESVEEAPARWCTLPCSARTARPVRSRAGKTRRSRGEGPCRKPLGKSLGSQGLHHHRPALRRSSRQRRKSWPSTVRSCWSAGTAPQPVRLTQAEPASSVQTMNYNA